MTAHYFTRSYEGSNEIICMKEMIRDTNKGIGCFVPCSVCGGNTLYSFICCVSLDKYIPISGLPLPICEMM